MALRLRSLTSALHPDLRVVECGAGILVGMPRPDRRRLRPRAASDRAQLTDTSTSARRNFFAWAALGASR